MIRRTAFAAVVLLLATGVPTACSDDDGTGPDVTRVTLQGTVESATGEGVEGLFAHLVTGSTATARGFAVAETGSDGSFALQGDVPTDECGSVQVWVLEAEAFLASAQRLGRLVVGSCEVEGPVTVTVQQTGGPI